MKLEDNSRMPFGKHKGERMEKVPARYLHWLWTNGLNKEEENPVHVYIKEKMSALQLEYKDGIW